MRWKRIVSRHLVLLVSVCGLVLLSISMALGIGYDESGWRSLVFWISVSLGLVFVATANILEWLPLGKGVRESYFMMAASGLALAGAIDWVVDALRRVPINASTSSSTSPITGPGDSEH